MDIEFIKLNFPTLYQTSKEFHSFKNTIIRNRIKMYGENSAEEINDFIKYNKILEKSHLINDSPISFQDKAALKEYELKKALLDESLKIKTLYNIKDSDMLFVLNLLSNF
jgi:hypothetical protein